MAKANKPATIEYWQVSDLRPYQRNARTHSPDQVAQIAASIREFGFTNPVLATADGMIIAGHGRVEAAKIAGLIEVPVLIVGANWSPEKIRAYVLADNKLALNAGWDEAILREELDELRGLNFDIGLIGFSEAELAALLVEKTDGLTEPDEVPEPPVQPVSRLGDLWLLGNHRIVCGDSTDLEVARKLMDGGRADICFTSPPYGAGKTAKLRDHYEKGKKSRRSFYDVHDDRPSDWGTLMGGWYAVARAICDLVVCNVQMIADNKVQLIEWLYDARADLCDVVVWDKVHGPPQMQSNVLNNAYEFLFLLGGNGSRSIPFSDFHGNISNIVRIDPKGKNEFAGVHRAVMPTDLAVWAMRDLCSKSKSVYEPFSGSGTTIIAGEMTGRRVLACELSPAYVDVAVVRWQNFTGQQATLESTGQTFDEVKAQRRPQ